MILDIKKYLPYMDEFDLTMKQKVEIIRTVYGLMESQIDQAFGVHSVQLAKQCKENSPLHPQKQCLDSNIINISDYFDKASDKEALNDNANKPERKVG